MKIDKYLLKAESSLTIFEFVSEGPKDLIRKLIQFQETNQANVYNLAFGDKNAETGGIDDLVISNNGDTDKVLATVVAALYAFLISILMHSYMPQGALAHERDYIEWASLGFMML